jgi:small-conductance mechanosensitive channel
MLGDIFRDHRAEVFWTAIVGGIVILAVWVLRRVIEARRASHPDLAPILLRTQNALIALVVVAAIRIVILGTGSSDERWVEILAHVMSIAFIVAVVWAICEVLVAVEGVLLSRYATHYAADGVRVRKANTQVILLRRLLVAIVITVGIGAILMTFPAVRIMGQGLLASAGLISIVAGLAAQTTLSNVFAGIQLALTDSIRVGDVVSAENESGTVGEITLTYVVLYLWDDRRLILPSSYFTTTPFENWTRWGDRINSVVLIDVDWSVPLDGLREEYTRAVDESPLWDKRSAAMAVADVARGVVQLRFSTSAASTSDMFGLNALVRETVVRFLASHGGAGVPRMRTEWLLEPPPGAGGGGS